MHRSHAVKRKVVVHHREHTLLHFSAVPGVKNNLLARGDVKHNRCLGVKTKLLVIFNLCFGCVVANEVGLKALKLLSGRVNEHILYKVSLPSNLHYKTDSHTGICVSATEYVHNIKLLVGKLLKSNILHGAPSCFAAGVIVILEFIRSPPNSVLRILVHNDKLILGRTSGVDTCHNVNRAKLGFLSLLKSLKSSIGFSSEKLLIGRVMYYLCSTQNAIFSQIQVFHFILFSYKI